MAQPNRERQNIIDAQICQLERELLELKRERNELSPISTLPPEILCQILLWATSLVRIPQHINALPEKLRVDGYIGTLCHVSHAWRSTALACPELWVEIDVGKASDPRGIDFMVQHAHAHPISFLARSHIPMPALAAAIQVLSGGDSVDSLFIYSDSLIMDELLHAAQPHTLRSLGLVLDIDFALDTASGLEIAQHPFFTRDTPSLRDLAINGFDIPLTSPILIRSPQLTSLSLPVLEDEKVSHILDILRNTPLLQFLCLGFMGPLQPSSGAVEPVLLPCLLHAVFDGDFNPVTAIISYLRTPRTDLILSIDCDVRSDSNLRQEGANLFRVLGEARRSPSGPEHLFSPRSLGLIRFPADRNGISRMQIGKWTPDSGNHGSNRVNDSQNTAVAAVLQVHGTQSGLDPGEWHPLFSVQHPKELPQLIGWSMDELSSVDIHDGWVYPASLWQLLSQCPRISNLTLHVCQMASLASLFKPREDDILTFPSLSCLQLLCGGGPPQSKPRMAKPFSICSFFV
ncbi:hypothetical protein NMY22_g15698 [Coprinellus aureogranulatus]|nr:hypothetical protein NMY22_g15698 [Coprinellus aureogranulatus]